MNSWTKWEAEKQLERAAEALRNNEFAVEVCADRAQAAEHIMAAVATAATVGFGGSVSLVEMDLPAVGLAIVAGLHPGPRPRDRAVVPEVVVRVEPVSNDWREPPSAHRWLRWIRGGSIV